MNRFSKLDNYPIPKLEDLLVALAGGEKYSKLNMSRAYNHLELDSESHKFLTINTQRTASVHTPRVWRLFQAWDISKNHGGIVGRNSLCDCPG